VEFVRRTNGQNEFKVIRKFGGGRYKIVTSSTNVKGKAGRGKSADHVTLDELRTHETWKAWSSLRKTIAAREEGQVWALSNAGDDSSVVLNALRDGAVALIEGADPDSDEVDDSVCLLEYSGEDECELDDWTQLRHANPAMGWIKSLERDIRSDLKTSGIPPEVIRSEVLCQRVGQLEGAVNLAAWNGSLDERGTLAHRRDRLALAVDVALDGAHVTAVLAGELGSDRVRVEAAGGWNDMGAAIGAMRSIIERTMPRQLVWTKNGPSAAIAVELRSLAEEFGIEAVEIAGGDLAEACQAFANLVQIGAVLHGSDALFDAQVQGAKKKRQGDGFVFVRSGKSHVDAVYAMALATRAARTLPDEIEDVEPMVIAAW
jgi:phage terminase large subunit-like protein